MDVVDGGGRAGGEGRGGTVWEGRRVTGWKRRGGGVGGKGSHRQPCLHHHVVPQLGQWGIYMAGWRHALRSEWPLLIIIIIIIIIGASSFLLPCHYAWPPRPVLLDSMFAPPLPHTVAFSSVPPLARASADCCCCCCSQKPWTHLRRTSTSTSMRWRCL